MTVGEGAADGANQHPGHRQREGRQTHPQLAVRQIEQNVRNRDVLEPAPRVGNQGTDPEDQVVTRLEGRGEPDRLCLDLL